MSEGIIVAIIGAIGIIVAAFINYRAKLKAKENKEAIINDIVMYGTTVGIRTCDGRYIMSKTDDDGRLYALAEHIKEWEFFEIVSIDNPLAITSDRPIRYGDIIALRNPINKNFVRVNDTAKKELIASVKHVKDWEKFILLPIEKNRSQIGKPIRYGNFFALQFTVTKSHVRYNRDGDKSLVADVPHIQDWETFSFSSPANPK